jgi:hypothetical protein
MKTDIHPYGTSRRTASWQDFAEARGCQGFVPHRFAASPLTASSFCEKGNDAVRRRAVADLAGRGAMKVKTEKYDTADYLDSPEMIALYLEEILQWENAFLAGHAIETVTRVRCKAPRNGI